MPAPRPRAAVPVLASLLLAALVAGCADPAPPGHAGFEGDRALRFDHVEGCAAHEPGELYRVVEDEAGWRALWAERCQAPGASPSPEAPEVDFALAHGVAAFAGEKPTGGYAVQVWNMTERADHVAILVVRAAPGPGCATTTALTYPADLVVAQRLTKAARFVFEDRVVDC